MRPIIIPIVAALLVQSGASAAVLRGKVIGVSDGDTLSVLSGQTSYKVRLAGIDAPEKAQPFGDKAKRFLSHLCFGKKVTVEEAGRDRYGRMIGAVRLWNGKSINRELVRSGYAWHYRKFSNDADLTRLETDAKTKKRGLWRDPEPVAPWVFRRSSAEKK